MLLSATGNELGIDVSNTYAGCLTNLVMVGTKSSMAFDINTLKSLLCWDDQLLVGWRTSRHQPSPASKPYEDGIFAQWACSTLPTGYIFIFVI
ncbi:hypothetical protein ASPCADRAFT_202750 [Aspergillus carbonarius ITEM 5010]|uniref:Uncharacterized protein n=1 Tax=Aspergillus carbonarius (strain ITEM 5010) TaxID=602072 RepID=A0A1R3S2J2_ASPC5|nr:hypothetical protein ASPCADRAFT_202750 [Aspergillus carbonarius ITEM 5010]